MHKTSRKHKQTHTHVKYYFNINNALKTYVQFILLWFYNQLFVGPYHLILISFQTALLAAMEFSYGK